MSSRTADEVGPFTILMRLIFKKIVMHLCLSFGLFGNVITLITLLEKRMRRSSTNQYLAAITLFDSIYILCSFIISLESNYPETQTSTAMPFINIVFYPLSDLSGNISIYCILLFTVERYVVVVYPLKSRELSRPSRARKILGWTFLFCLIATFPTFLENTVVYEWSDELNNTMPVLIHSNIYPNFDLYKSTYFWIIAILFQFIPLALLIIFNTFLMRNLNTLNTESISVGEQSKQFIGESIRLSKASSEQSIRLRVNVVNIRRSEQNKATYLLVTTVLIFLVCQLPSAFLLIYITIFPIGTGNGLLSDDLVIGFNNIANGLVAINASINFILYSCLSQKFRANFQRIFLFKKLDQNGVLHQSRCNLSNCQ